MQPIRYTLSNGLRVVLVPMPQSLTATALVMVEAGSAYETKNESGIAHMLEHMCFKGTTRRPSAKILATELDRLGAANNAFTSYEYTGYYAKVGKEKLLEAFDIIADLYLNPLIPESELEKEKGVVIEEINMYEDMPQSQAAELSQRLLYGDQPLGWDIAGTKETVSSFTREALVNFRTKHYVPEATVVTVAGAFDEATIRTAIESSFSALPKLPKAKREKAVITPASLPQFAAKERKADQAHIVLGFRAFSMYDDRRHILRVLSAVLTRGGSSRLYSLLRDELGICYYINSGIGLLAETGSLRFYAGVDTKRAQVAVDTIVGELQRMRDELVGEDELSKIKDSIRGSQALGLETSDSFADFYGDQELYGFPLLSPDEIMAKIEAVTAEEIRTLARELFVSENSFLAVSGPEGSADLSQAFVRPDLLK